MGSQAAAVVVENGAGLHYETLALAELAEAVAALVLEVKPRSLGARRG